MTHPTLYQSIVSALTQRDMTSAELHEITGFTAMQIRNAIAAARRNGKQQTPIYIVGHIRTRSTRIAIYSLTRPVHQTSSKKITPRYMPPFRELTPEDHDIYAGRDLAMLAR